jgi:3-hydroxyacyl-[acyl-carrier-protein] dehydratase
MSLTPHGVGFSFVDAVELLGDHPPRLRATKWLDPTLPFFADHFPGQPLMPGVLIIEMAAQAAGALWGRAAKAGDRPIAFTLAQVNDFRLKRPAHPGDNLICEVQLEREFGALAQFSAEIRCAAGENIIATGNITLARPST